MGSSERIRILSPTPSFEARFQLTVEKGVLGLDRQRPRLRNCRSAATKAGGTEIRDTTKTGETGDFELPEWLAPPTGQLDLNGLSSDAENGSSSYFLSATLGSTFRTQTRVSGDLIPNKG